MGTFRMEPKQYNLYFEDPALKGLEVRLSGMSMAEVRAFDILRLTPAKDVEELDKRTLGIAETIVAHLDGWNLAEADGSPTPMTVAGLQSHDQEVQNAITKAYVDALRGVSVPLERGSTPGVDVSSLPTETLPPSP